MNRSLFRGSAGARTAKRVLCLMLAAVLLSFCLSACAPSQGGTEGKSFRKTDDLKNARIGVVTGSVQEILLPERLPEADYRSYNGTVDAAMALLGGKVDAFATDEPVYIAMLWEGRNIARLEEAVAKSEYAFLFGKGMNGDVREKLGEFLRDAAESGELERIKGKWFSGSEPGEFADYKSLSGENGTLKVALSSTEKPFAYKKGDKFAGLDIDVLTAFAEEYGYALDITDTNFTDILSGVSTGSYDIGASGVTVTEERRGSFDYSESYATGDIVLVVEGSGDTQKTLSDFENGTLGVIDGSIYAGYSKELFPNAKVASYQSFMDLFQCVKQGKIDGFLLDLPNFNAVKRTDEGLSYVTVPGYSVEIGYAFGSDELGRTIRTQMNEFLAELEQTGKADELWEKWCGETEPAKGPDIPDLSGNTKVLKVAIDLSRKPFVYMLNNEYVGYEIEVLYLFCREYGYGIEFESAQWTAGVAGLHNENGVGKYDIVSCGIYMTEERKETVNFSDPYMVADVVMVTYDHGGEEDFFASIAESFENTFIREDRWKLILKGIGVTLLVSVLSVLGGTMLGFGLYMLLRSKNKVLSGTARVVGKIYSKIIAGTPALVILMLLSYVVFGSVDISGVIVSVIGMALIFGAFVYGQLELAVSGVDGGQLEAAYALGYGRNRAFFRIILPQALKMFLPVYTGEVVGLVKATSVVGYIAVNDLTKMGDIIRSNTYEPFFPLIAVAVIYFVLTFVIAELLGILCRKLDPKKRKNKNILKGVAR